MAEVEIGMVSDYFSNLMVAGIDLTGDLKTGDTLHIIGHTTDIAFCVQSMQVDHQDVDEAKAGQSVGVKVPDKVRKGDRAYRITG